MKASTQLLRPPPSALLRPTPSALTSSILTSSPSPGSKQPNLHSRPSPRPFVSNPLSLPLQTLHASSLLPYTAPSLFALIADIAAYPTFLPYCTSSTITSWSSPHASTGKKYPRSATLAVGFNSYSESFLSQVFCAPDRVVEAVCGNARTTIPEAELQHYKEGAGALADTPRNQIFELLLTRWALRPFPYKPPPTKGRSEEEGGEKARNAAEANPENGEKSPEAEPRTEVDLYIEVKFTSPIYAALSQAAAPKVAGMLVDAFERRAEEVLGRRK
ncbi:hypothetical protein MMC30_001059 [Trapelia coarctata]|nr:hypothetical protein [Trapelia coarctata]